MCPPRPQLLQNVVFIALCVRVDDVFMWFHVMALEYRVWGPKFWFTIHTMAKMYPDTPNEVTRKKYYETIHNIPVFFPQFPLGDAFSNMLERYPVTPYLDSKTAFMKWLHFIYCKVRVSVGEMAVPLDGFIRDYDDKYIPEVIMEKNDGRLRQQIALIGVLVVVVGLSIAMYRR